MGFSYNQSRGVLGKHRHFVSASKHHTPVHINERNSRYNNQSSIITMEGNSPPPPAPSPFSSLVAAASPPTHLDSSFSIPPSPESTSEPHTHDNQKQGIEPTKRDTKTRRYVDHITATLFAQTRVHSTFTTRCGVSLNGWETLLPFMYL